ncbi:MAG: hypothetical protein Q8L85_01555 [Alphaproteobacteria bacterium]|nr:hypothetical protein [Alphaproteobacteria bacterium]
MKTRKTTLLIISLLALFLSQASAEPISLGVKGSTLGIGAESSYRHNSWLSLTGSVNGLKLTSNNSTKDLFFNSKVRFLTAGASLGFHPFKSGFKLLTGLFYNGNQFELSDVRLKNNITLNNVNITPDQVGQANLKVHYQRVSPYLGLAFDAALYNNSPWSFTGELGVLFQFSPKATLTRTGARNFPSLKRFLEDKVEKAASKNILKYFPVMSIGLKYVF